MPRQSQNKIKEFVDNLLLLNLFTVILFAVFFIFAVIMKLYGVFIFLDFVQKLWNPVIVPLITILIISSVVIGINSWLKQLWLSQEEDI